MLDEGPLDRALANSCAATGELGALVLAVDWSRTPLGPMSRWPRSLKSLLCTVLEMPTPAIIFWGPDQTQLYNRGYAAIMGPRHPKYLGAPYKECWPDTYPLIFPWMQRVLERGEVIQVTNTNINVTRHGFDEEAHFTFTFSPLRDDEGQIAGIFQPVVEVTDAVLAERRRETLRVLAQQAHAAEAIGDVAGALASNARDLPFALVFVRAAPDRRVELAAHSGFHSPEVGRAAGLALLPAVERALRESSAVAVDDVEAVLGGRHFGPWPEPTRSAIALPLRRSAADVTRGVAVFGISPRLPFEARYREFLEAIARELAVNLEAAHAKGAERGLLAREQAARRDAEQQKEHLAALLTQAPTPMVILRGPALRIELANEYACRVWRRDHADVIHRPIFEALPELRGHAFERLLLQVLRTGELVAGSETRILLGRADDGPPREACFNFVYAPLRDGAGAVDGILVLAVEVTEQVRAREQVEQLRAAAESASQAKDEFLAMLGHELRNPLAPILTSLQLMRLRGGTTLERERTVIERQANHLVRLVDDLLDVSRFARGKVELKKERVELAEVVARAIEVASPLLERRKHELVVDVPARGLLVEVDPVRLAQAIANLLTNAAKYTDDGGRVTIVAVRPAVGGVELRVQDTGVGVEAHLLPRIFDMFVQERQELDRSQGGLGLGLTIVRSLVTLHGGTIEARSEGRGRGSEFVIRLPETLLQVGVEAPDGRPTTAPRPTPDARRVLIVDDNEDAADMLSTYLEAVGHVTAIAHDGPAALHAAPGFGPDAALVDIGLPVMDGYELANRLREQPGLERLTLIAVTGYGLPADRERSATAGFDAHLVKPVDLEELKKLLRSLRASVGQG